MANVELLGGRYTGKQNPDGTLDIFDVPIVSELAKGERQDLPEFEITGDWLKAALDRANTRAAAGYLPPLHVHHQDDGPPKPRAGYFRPKSVSPLDLGGKKVQTLFADLLRIPAAVAKKIMSGELPYRSVEILNVNSEPEVDSLALLDSQPPQFRYPILSLAKLLKSETAEIPALAATAGRTAAVAFASFPAANAAAVVCKFGGSTMADEEKDKKDAEMQAAAADGTPPWVASMTASLTAAVSKAVTDALTAHASAQASAAAGAGAAAPPPVEDPEVQKLADTSEEAKSGKPTFVDPTVEKFAAKAISDLEAKLTAKFNKELAASAGEVVSLKAQLAERTKKDAERDALSAEEKLVASALKELTGYPLDDETRAQVARFAKLGKEPLDAFVATAKRLAPKDPPSSVEALFASDAHANDSPTVARFAGRPEKMAEARQLSAAFKSGKEKGFLPANMTEERYFAIHMPQESVA